MVLAGAGSQNVPTVTENGNILTPSSSGGVVAGNSNWLSYRYNLTQATSNVKISSAGTIQAEIFGASGAAGFGGYYSGFGDAPSYTIAVSGTTLGYICSGIGTISVDSGLGTYQWYKNGSPIAGATNNSYTLSTTQDLDPASYYVVVTLAGGCTVTSNQIESDICPCTKPGVGGTPDSYTKLGISIRDQKSTANWPLDIGNGFLTMEANKKGFVITRIANPETAIPQAVLGMLVYDTAKDCLKLYNGTEWKCIKPTCN